MTLIPFSSVYLLRAFGQCELEPPVGARCCGAAGECRQCDVAFIVGAHGAWVCLKPCACPGIEPASLVLGSGHGPCHRSLAATFLEVNEIEVLGLGSCTVRPTEKSIVFHCLVGRKEIGTRDQGLVFLLLRQDESAQVAQLCSRRPFHASGKQRMVLPRRANGALRSTAGRGPRHDRVR